ncbi:hypothetical protein IAU60_005509 [Kwoniella sp. DSM 27419]
MSVDYSGPTPGVQPPPVHRKPSESTSGSGSPSRLPRSARSPRLSSHPILLHPLPPSSAITKESVYASELELDRQTKQISRERALKEALQDQVWSVERAAVRDEQGTWAALQASTGAHDKGKGKASESWGNTPAFTRPPQAYELYRAIDKHDIEFLMRVRDHAFHLLLQKNGAEFPIVYASRLGDQWRDVVILLVGALSRYVNHLDPEDFDKPETKNTLKSLRANLKLAIDHTLLHLPPGQTPLLLSSYLQVLIMSEGDSFLHKSMQSVSLLLRSWDPASVPAIPGSSTTTASDRVRPVAEAEDIVRRFCTKELRGVKGGVGDVEDYVSNAVLDLLIMSAWSIAATQLGVEYLPTHTFARDLRTWTMLDEAMGTHSSQMTKVNPRIRKLLDKLRELAGDSKKGIRGRLRDVRHVLDGD